MKKPILETGEPHLDYHDCDAWIGKKLGKDLRNYAGKTYSAGDTKPYLDFWHYVIEGTEIHNGCYFWLAVRGEEIEECEPWQKEILAAYAEEFNEYLNGDDLYFWVSW